MNEKNKIYEIATSLDTTSKIVIEKAKEIGIKLASPQSTVSHEELNKIIEHFKIKKQLSKNINSKEIEFRSLIVEIHRVNKGWHSFETSNRFLEQKDNYLQSYYRKKKNGLQKELESNFTDMIHILPEDETGFKSIVIKEEYRFDEYKDACHKI
ncbi:MAG: translation initiation factor IF-2 N-terminal domain-containing protein [Campylobacterota bacterium]|nr:translation initiation factor IF-2 N-terminal domain-containing protein [Campylobacterota bacterium]